MKIVAVTNEEELQLLAGKANEVWHEYFPCILSEEQIDYMVDKFQSEHAIQEQLAEGYEYFLFYEGEQFLGYTGLHAEEKQLFLSKLYLMKENRGKGYATPMLEFVEQYAREHHCASVYLTVNKENSHSIEVYKKKGFQTIRSQVADIGQGYVMDDYVMEKGIH